MFRVLFVKDRCQYVEFRRLLVAAFHEAPRLLALGFGYNRLQTLKLRTMHLTHVELRVVVVPETSFEDSAHALKMLRRRAFLALFDRHDCSEVMSPEYTANNSLCQSTDRRLVRIRLTERRSFTDRRPLL